MEISDSTEERLLRCDMGENSKTSLIEDEAKEDITEDDWDGNEFTELQIEALEDLESSELDKSTVTSTTTIKTEPISDDDIVFVVPMKGLQLLKKPSNRSILVLKP